ncbi:MAG TPA: Holliday junction branch migration protein RuvA [Blastocatellia bacterium]|nr:Holliday junction branch migration protein RuvA [Blastocatellia bacterium]
MIAYLSGKLLQKQPNSVIINVGGVGYEVTIPLSTFYGLGEAGADVALKIHTNVREDAIQLFGFSTSGEKELFLRLTSVTGIGPKLAIVILSGMPVVELITAIRTNNVVRLTAIPGIGRKTAERLALELRDKLAGISLDEGGPQAAAAMELEAAASDVRDDTIAALVQLGYPKPVAERAVSAALREGGDTSIQAVLRRALKNLSR